MNQSYAWKTLNDTLKQVESHDDAKALAVTIMELTKKGTRDDYLRSSGERHVLTAMIEEESKKANSQDLANIFAMIEGDLDSALNENQHWLNYKQCTSEHFRKYAITNLEHRLTSLQLFATVN